MNEAEEDEKVWNSLDNNTRIAVASHIIRQVNSIGRDGGSFRYFIYNLLGFGPEAYVPLYEAGGMTITNEYDLNLKESIRQIAEKNNYSEIKEVLGLCDEPGCFKNVSCGFPTEAGYRHTCSEHSKEVIR